jgi:hypothetical protein
MLDHDGEGRLLLTDEFLKAYLARPEIMPPDEACAAERALHAGLLAAPRRPVAAGEIAALADPDARENWELFLGFRDRLLAAPTLEAAYVRMIREGVGAVPPLFLAQLVHVIARNALDGCEDPFTVRAAECLYRPQRATFHEGTVLLADADMIERHEHDRHASPLLAMLGGPAVSELDVLTLDNAAGYWGRSDAFDMVLDLGGDPSGRAAFARVIEAWVRHLHGVEVEVSPLESVEDADWRWFAGLDAEATRIGNRLWKGEAPDAEALARVLALFRLEFGAGAPVIGRAAGHPVYLIMASDSERMLRLKPQNLVTGLPLAEPESVN